MCVGKPGPACEVSAHPQRESILLPGAQILNLLPPLGVKHFISDPRSRVFYGVKQAAGSGIL